MSKRDKPITVFCADAVEASCLAAGDKNARALTGGIGTLNFHSLLAAHGAGEFEFLYAPLALKGKFMTPAGGEVRFTEEAENARR